MPRRLPVHSIWAIPDLAIPTLEMYLNRWARAERRPAACEDDGGERQEKARKPRGTPTAGPAGDAQRDGAPMWMEGGVAVIEVMGVMIKGGSSWWGEAATERITEAAIAARIDPDIGAVALLLDTPGGSVDGLAELADAVAGLASVKPVLAQVSGLCASAGYYTAANATAIYANRMDLVGSIGTRMMLYDFSKYYEEAGVKAIPIDTGTFKSAGALGTVVTDEQIAYFQSIVDAYFKDFASIVSKGRARSMTPDKVKAASDGRVWTAPEALKMGLIDGIQGFAETMSMARAKATEAFRQRNIRAGIATRGQLI